MRLQFFDAENGPKDGRDHLEVCPTTQKDGRDHQGGAPDHAGEMVVTIKVVNPTGEETAVTYVSGCTLAQLVFLNLLRQMPRA